MNASPPLSVVMPAFNEAAKVAGTLAALRAALPPGTELVVSDDGSTDATADAAGRLAASDPGIRLVRNPHRGRGGALKAGLAAASGAIVVSVDADLSYGPRDVLRLSEHLGKHPGCDLVIGSCYMPGGKVEGVPARRLWVSRWGNVLLRFAFEGRFWTTTGILRGYRREKLQALLPTLVSDGKELYLEFLHKALAAGWRIEEIPATLTWRRGPGDRSFSFLPTARSHLGFLFARRCGLTLWVVLTCLLLLPGLYGFALAGHDHDIPLLTPAWEWAQENGALKQLALWYSALAFAGVALLSSVSLCRWQWRIRLGPASSVDRRLWWAALAGVGILVYVLAREQGELAQELTKLLTKTLRG